MRLAFLFFFFLFSCSSVERIDKTLKNDFFNFLYSSCSVHFCFYSNENQSFQQIIGVAESVFNYIIINYSFEKMDEYPYTFVLTSSKTVNSYPYVIHSTSTCDITYQIIKRIADDIFSSNKELYPWLYWGFVNHTHVRFCPEREFFYSNILNSELNIMGLAGILSYRPLKEETSKDNIYYANSYLLIKNLVERYSYYTFSLFVNELFRNGDIRNSSVNIFGEDIFLIYKKMGR